MKRAFPSRITNRGADVNPIQGVPSIPVEDKREPTQELTPERRLGAVLKLLRESLGLSQDSVAKSMSDFDHSWRQTTVAKTEAGARPIRVNEVVDLARVLGTSSVDLMYQVEQDSEEQARLLLARSQVERAARAEHQALTALAERRMDLVHARGSLNHILRELGKEEELDPLPTLLVREEVEE